MNNETHADELTELVRTTIARMWQDLLGVEEPADEDDFFVLGGYSLLAIKMRARLEHRFGVRVALVELFEHPTLAANTALVLEKLCADLAGEPVSSPATGRP